MWSLELTSCPGLTSSSARTRESEWQKGSGLFYELAKSDISLEQQVCQEHRKRFLCPAKWPLHSPSRLLGFSFPSVFYIYLFSQHKPCEGSSLFIFKKIIR